MASEPASRFDELKKQVERASKLIARLREANYSLGAELLELHRKIGSSEPSLPAAAAPPAAKAPVNKEHEELQLLRDERKIIRAKVQNLLDRIEKIDL